MKVCIAEKPSVAREIASILGANARKDGYFEGNGYQVTWTFGHFCTLKEPHEYTQEWKKWSLFVLPMIPPRFGIKVIDNDGVSNNYTTSDDTVKGIKDTVSAMSEVADNNVEVDKPSDLDKLMK